MDFEPEQPPAEPPASAPPEQEQQAATAQSTTKSRRKNKKKNRKPRKPHQHSSHWLLLGWCFWLIASWAVTLHRQSVAVASTLMMPFAAVVGLIILWPMLRLSQWDAPAASLNPPARAGWRTRRGGGFILFEWLCLNVVFQAVVWPLMLNARWTIAQTFWLDIAVAGWSLLAALIIAWGRLFESAGVRIFAMGLCVLTLLGEPLAMAVINLATQPGDGVLWQMKVSPIELIWRMTRPFGGGATFASTAAGQFGPQVAAVTAAAVLGWVMYTLRPKPTGPVLEAEPAEKQTAR